MNNRWEDVCGVCYFNPCRQLNSLTGWTFVGKVMSLPFNMLFRLVIACTGGSDSKASACNAGDPDSIPGLGRSLEKEMAPTPVFLPRKLHGWRNLVGSMGSQRVGYDWATSLHFFNFLPRNKCLLISWLQSPSAVILEPPKIKPVTVYIVSPSICHEVMGPDAMI